MPHHLETPRTIARRTQMRINLEMLRNPAQIVNAKPKLGSRVSCTTLCGVQILARGKELRYVRLDVGSQGRPSDGDGHVYIDIPGMNSR